MFRNDPLAFDIISETQCIKCRRKLDPGSLIILDDQGPRCLDCAGQGDLAFLARGDAALSRRARKYAERFFVVVRFSRSRRRYERQGILVEPGAIERAERECAEDKDQRRENRARAARQSEVVDQRYVEEFAWLVQQRYPGCPGNEARAVARHACEKYSGRIGRTAAAKNFDVEAIDLAVQAHIRHQHTDYDLWLAEGIDKFEAREMAGEGIRKIMDLWSEPSSRTKSWSGRRAGRGGRR